MDQLHHEPETEIDSKLIEREKLAVVRQYWRRHLSHAPKPLDFAAYQKWHIEGTKEDYNEYLEERLAFFKRFAHQKQSLR